MKAVINTTPLISLAAIDKLSLLDELFENIYIPNAVFKEATRKGKKNATVIENWGKNRIVEITDIKEKSALELTLDEGESEVIVLAQEVDADLVIIDEDKARKVSKLNGLNVTGTIGVLLDAKKQGKISLLKPFLDRLIANGMYIGVSLYDNALLHASEKIDI
ncbi:MAG: DUF3368 domain-containing protein [Deltaproteobacteria bacterium]|nr:DUF3368 domain-containing protein [Deltaproteobacteria bacterium]